MNVPNSSQPNRHALTINADWSNTGSLPLWGGLGWGSHAWRISGIRGDQPVVYPAGRASSRMFAARDGPVMDCFSRVLGIAKTGIGMRTDCFVVAPRNDDEPGI